jgi:hypothetical protein
MTKAIEERTETAQQRQMNAGGKTGLLATQYKSIDGLQIRFAINDRKDGDPILLLSPLPESILAFLPTWEILSIGTGDRGRSASVWDLRVAYRWKDARGCWRVRRAHYGIFRD